MKGKFGKRTWRVAVFALIFVAGVSAAESITQGTWLFSREQIGPNICADLIGGCPPPPSE